MKKLLLSSLILLLAFFTINIPFANSHTNLEKKRGAFPNKAVIEDKESKQSIEAIISKILSKQKVDTIKEINCGKVTDSNFERLGDAIMEGQHSGFAHERMDRMMGGEGSESLKQMHINMGNAYLGCKNSDRQGMVTMGGFSMMGFDKGMMNNGFGILISFTWIIFISFLITGIYFFLKQSNKNLKIKNK